MGSQSNYRCANKSIMRGLAYHRKLYKLLEAWQRVSAPELELHVEPWLKHSKTGQRLQPDAVIVDPASRTGYAVEVKLNWKDGRDEKLIRSYIPAVCEAFSLSCVWPVLITSNVAGLKQEPRLGLGAIEDCCAWQVGEPTPVLLVL